MVDVEAIARARVKLGADPMGGASVQYWSRIAERFGLDLTVVNDTVDPRFAFMPLDHDGKIRMDCSSPYAMAGLLALRDRFAVAFGNDTDADRHGIVTPTAGLMNPNHYLAVAIDYLFTHRDGWPAGAAVGKTLVSSTLIDRVARALGREVREVPVGFKWFVPGLRDGSLGFGGEESAGASFLRRDGGTWTTDKDGILLDLLAGEITAVTGQDPGVHYERLRERFGTSYYARVDAPATPAEKAALGKLSPEAVTARDAGRRPDRRQADPRARQRRRHRRPQGRERQRLVRRPPIGDGERLQDLRGEHGQRRPPRRDPRRGARDRGRRARALTA